MRMVERTKNKTKVIYYIIFIFNINIKYYNNIYFKYSKIKM